MYEDPILPPPPPAYSSEDKMWVILSHVSMLMGVGILLPLVVYLVKKQDAPVVAEHAREALNFHICVYAYSVLSMVLCIFGIPLFFVIPLAAAIFSIVAAVKASDGEMYRYPLTIRLV